MARRIEWAGQACPIARAVDVLGEPWTLLILRNANTGTTRFDEFRGELGIADNVLSTRLGKLTEAGLLARVPYRDGGRTRDEYRLTKAGADALPVLLALAAWGDEHTRADPPAGRMRVIHRACGAKTRPAEHCAHCGEPMPREEQLWYRPWRSREPVPLVDPVS
ncbi:helix-turn-helix transcriptional regulator [Amycolatopsis sp. NBC_00345]|jgi:DNA-binding HxlR family transcriptional regulator|uniref:winged helix-turn-helix transcriptional regulator n=1 Tax=Amycolatopsis sp. NBC_00345 TaxID=2975955 RepID=UPI002E26E942